MGKLLSLTILSRQQQLVSCILLLPLLLSLYQQQQQRQHGMMVGAFRCHSKSNTVYQPSRTVNAANKVGRTTAVLNRRVAEDTTATATATIMQMSSASVNANTNDEESVTVVSEQVERLKKVLRREYITFFAPMQCEYYSEAVTFDDPLTSLAGVQNYQKNVDMLASRTFLGKFLFQDAGIVLHSVEGGEVTPNNDDGTPTISSITTRWTLRVTAKVIPWSPTARFTGISVYKVSQGGSEGVIIDHQTDYWDSINIQKDGTYDKVDISLAVKDFLQQLKPQKGKAAAAGVELPYQLLRRGKDYELRRYPAYTTATIPYDRRDEGYDVLASVTKGIEPMSPSVMVVPNDDSTTKKTMSWPLVYAAPGEVTPSKLPQVILDRSQTSMFNDCQIEEVPSQVVAVGTYTDASVAPIVRRADKKLRESLERDGILIPATTSSVSSESSSAVSVKFAQYDAIFSLGTRRGEVWIDLDNEKGHPY